MVASEIPPLTLRFRRWAGPVGKESIFFLELIKRATGRPVEIIESPFGSVDIQIESVYGEGEPPKLQSRATRFLRSHLPGGISFDDPRLSTNQQPTGDARFRIFFTGENERPPQGRWDAYLSFDVHSYEGRNSYLPLWWITSSDILVPTISPYLGRPITLDQMMSSRKATYQSCDKFCAAFIGKAYPFRMQSIAALSKVGKVDVFGAIARNTRQTRADEKFEVSQRYKFVFAFENDYFPGYVTEKLPEAWATGAVPLYWGCDVTNSLNASAFLNAAAFATLEEFVEEVDRVASSEELWTSIASQPLIVQKPSIGKVLENLRRILAPLRIEP
jgi:hypothetical protein